MTYRQERWAHEEPDGRTVEALTTALLDAQEQHRQDAATIDYLISKTLDDDACDGHEDDD